MACSKLSGPTSIFNGATNFIYTEVINGKHVPGLNEKALNELKQMREKVIVVSIVGAYRTGKSFLLSRLLKEAKSKVKFQVGHLTEPQTKGLWLMVVDHPVRHGYKLALIDTEGIGDTEKGDTQHDTTLFVLTCLLSNTLIYNGKNAIDETAFEKLGAELSKYMISKSKTDGDDANFHEVFPELVYVVRDFSLQLKSKDREITSDEYLENALKVDKSDDPEAPRSKVRKCITKYFSKRHCFTLDIPAANKRILHQMDSVGDEKLNEDFIEAMDGLCKYIMFESESRSLQNAREINGQQLATLIETYVNAYRDGKVPNVASAMENLKMQENRKVVADVLTGYLQAMGQYQLSRMPTDTREEVIAEHTRQCQTFIKMAQPKAILEDCEIDKFFKEIETKLNTEKEKFEQENERLSREACNSTLKKLNARLLAKRTTIYNQPGGYSKYRTDKKDLEHAYADTNCLGVMKKSIWLKFAKDEEANDETIMETDKLLTAKEKEVAAQRHATEQAERERKRSELEKERAEEATKAVEARLKESQAMKEDMRRQNEEEKEARLEMAKEMMELKKGHKKYQEDAEEYKKMIAKYKEKEAHQAVEQAEREKKRIKLEEERAEEAKKAAEARLKESEATKEYMRRHNEEMKEMKEQHKKALEETEERIEKLTAKNKQKGDPLKNILEFGAKVLLTGAAAATGGLLPAAVVAASVLKSNNDNDED